MTLSARIRIPPSRRVAILETSIAVGGIAVVGETFLERWPGMSSVIGAATVLAAGVACAVAARCWRGRRTRVFIVADHAEVAVAGSADVWRIAEPSLVRPGFSVLALARDDRAGRGLQVPVFDADLAAADRRALHRYLGWCLRGGTAGGTS